MSTSPKSESEYAAPEEDEKGASSALPAPHFMPFQRRDLLRMLRSEGSLDPTQSSIFDRAVQEIETFFAREFHEQRQQLKALYAPFDPDADTRALSVLPSASLDDPDKQGFEAEAELDDLETALVDSLQRANYELLDEADLKRAFRSASLFQIRLKVNLKAYRRAFLYCRGSSKRSETLSLFFGLVKRRIEFTNFDRVLLFLEFAEQPKDSGPEVLAGRVMIKLFQNVPDADLEMLFPNTRVAMRWSDRLLIGIPALASGAVVVMTKLSSTLLLLATLIGFWLGVHSEPVTLDKQGLIIIGAGLGALGAYLWKQWSSYRNRKARFRQALTRDLYFKLLDNNAGVLLRILDDAEDSECKESYVALYFLMRRAEPISSKDLDQQIEAWFAANWSTRVDFDIDDALAKLARIGLAQQVDGLWSRDPGSSASYLKQAMGSEGGAVADVVSNSDTART
ncbi:MAG: DUF3754 domain-containing protein [Pseudomonadota bacterium]